VRDDAVYAAQGRFLWLSRWPSETVENRFGHPELQDSRAKDGQKDGHTPGEFELHLVPWTRGGWVRPRFTYGRNTWDPDLEASEFRATGGEEDLHAARTPGQLVRLARQDGDGQLQALRPVDE
jgi:hypothetical protein